jgi:hypothetical protein
VIEVVFAGFALTAFLYHLIRIRAARRMKASPVEDRLIQSHLEVTAQFAPRGSQPADLTESPLAETEKGL